MRYRQRNVTGRTFKTLAVLLPAVWLGTAVPDAIAQTEPTASSSLTLTTRLTTQSSESHYSRSAEGEIRFQEGLLHYSRSQLPAAEADFKALVAEDPGDSESYYYLGLSQLDQNKPGEAVGNFDQSIRIDSSRDEVRGARATANIRLHKFDAAKEDLAILDNNPRFRTLSTYLRGQLLYAQGDLDGASKAFAAAKAQGGTESAPAEFYEGLTYIRMKELVRARSAFRESSLEPDRDPTLAAASRQLDAVLAAQQSRAPKAYEGQITAGYEYDTNVIQLGSDIPTPAGISNQSDGRFVLQPRGSYTFLRSDRLELGVEGAGYFTWQNSLSPFDIDSYQAGPFANYKLTENLYLSARYAFNYVEFGYAPFLVRNVLTPQVTYVEKDFGYTSAFYQFQSREFKQAPVTTALNRSGTDHAIGFVQGINLPELFKGAGAANLELNYRFEDQEARGSDFSGKFNAVGATFYTPLPVWKLRYDVGATVDFEDYDHANSLDARFRHRQDTEVDVATGFTKEINKDLAVRVDYSFTNRNSNIVTTGGQHPYGYDRHVVGVRLIYSF